MVSAGPSELGRIGIRFGLRPPFRSSSDWKSDSGSGGFFPAVVPDGRPPGPLRRSGPGGKRNLPATKNPAIPRG